MKHISALQRDLSHYQSDAKSRHDQLANMRNFPFDQINSIDRRLEAMERSMQQIKLDVGDKDYKKHMEDLRRAMQDSHSSLMEGLTGSLGSVITGSAPRMGFFLFVILGFQGALVMAYVMYKRRRSMAPKKYL